MVRYLSQVTPVANQRTDYPEECQNSIARELLNEPTVFPDDRFHSMKNPALKKIFKDQRSIHWKFLEKDVADEMIFRTENPRNRLMLELMARGGMRVGEVLKLTPNDVEDRKIFIRDPKSGKEMELVFIPQKAADRLKEYIRDKGIGPDERIFPITYADATVFVFITVLKGG